MPLLRSERLIASLLIILCAIMAYGLLIPRLGFYWDDWPLIWLVDTQGIGAIGPYSDFDRPALAPVFAFGFSLFNTNALAWHVVGMGLRIASGLVLLSGLRKLWPDWHFATTMIALLFVIYPGFSQQPNALIYFSHFVALLFVVVSFTSMIYAITSEDRRYTVLYTIIGAVTCFAYLIMFEFFLGIEVLRLLLLWYMSDSANKSMSLQRINRMIRRWLPYLGVTLTFLIWRVFFFSSQREGTNIEAAITDRFKQAPVQEIVNFGAELFRDFFEAVVFAWFAPVYEMWRRASSTSLILAVVILVITMGLVAGYGYLLRRRSQSSDQPNERQAIGLVMLGIIAFPPGIFITLIADRNLRLLSAFDRYTLPVLLSTVFVVSGTLYLISGARARTWLFAFLVGFSISFHLLNANVYRNEGTHVQDMWWQIAWRVPQVEDGTVFVIEDANNVIQIRADYTVWGIANLIYQDDNDDTPRLNGQYLDENVLSDIRGQIVEDSFLRNIDFTRDYRNSLIVARQNNACLRLIDAERLEVPVHSSGQLILASAYSRIDQIITDAESTRPPKNIFGEEPAHNWCYYFQKADLARQSGDYEGVVSLLAEANDQGYSPEDPTEWYPFIESYVALNRTDEAMALINTVIDEEPSLNLDMCRMLNRIDKLDVYSDLSCQS